MEARLPEGTAGGRAAHKPRNLHPDVVDHLSSSHALRRIGQTAPALEDSLQQQAALLLGPFQAMLPNKPYRTLNFGIIVGERDRSKPTSRFPFSFCVVALLALRRAGGVLHSPLEGAIVTRGVKNHTIRIEY